MRISSGKGWAGGLEISLQAGFRGKNRLKWISKPVAPAFGTILIAVGPMTLRERDLKALPGMVHWGGSVMCPAQSQGPRTMSARSVPLHVFLSYARPDHPFVDRLGEDLARAGITVWVDRKDLVPGTPNWEAAIREAIDQSLLVVLVCSPAARQSVYVRAELSVAQGCECPVIPVWADGDRWIDSIPLELVNAQYVDCRGDGYVAGLTALTGRVRDVLNATVPDCYRLPNYRTKTEARGGWARYHTAPIPLGCLVVERGEGCERPCVGGDAFVMKPHAYPSLRALLDDLYVQFLADRYPPYTYGSRWLLAETGINPRLLVPWDWLTCRARDQFRLDPAWSTRISPAECGLTPGSGWEVCEAKRCELVLGVAVEDERLLQALRRSPKAEYFLTQAGYLAEVEANTVGPDANSIRVVLGWGGGLGGGCGSHKVLRQTDKLLDDDPELEYWLKRTLPRPRR